MAARLADIAMELAEAARIEALREMKPPPERRMPPIPGLPTLPGIPAFHTYRDTTFNELFDTLSRCARQAILLEARIDGGGFDHLRPTDSPPCAEPKAAEPRPRGPGDTTRLTCERLEDDLAADTGRSPDAIIAGICDELRAVIAAHRRADPPRPAITTHPAPARPHRTPPKPPAVAANPPPSPATRPVPQAIPPRPERADLVAARETTAPSTLPSHA